MSKCMPIRCNSASVLALVFIQLLGFSRRLALLFSLSARAENSPEINELDTNHKSLEILTHNSEKQKSESIFAAGTSRYRSVPRFRWFL